MKKSLNSFTMIMRTFKSKNLNGQKYFGKFLMLENVAEIFRRFS